MSTTVQSLVLEDMETHGPLTRELETEWERVPVVFGDWVLKRLPGQISSVDQDPELKELLRILEDLRVHHLHIMMNTERRQHDQRQQAAAPALMDNKTQAPCAELGGKTDRCDKATNTESDSVKNGGHEHAMIGLGKVRHHDDAPTTELDSRSTELDSTEIEPEHNSMMVSEQVGTTFFGGTTSENGVVHVASSYGFPDNEMCDAIMLEMRC